MNQFYIIFQRQYFLLLFFIILFGTLAIVLGQDANWDLRNYHFYNGYAFLFHRIGWDVAPAGEQSFLNPFFDVLNYLLITKLPPWGVSFVLGVISGINCFLIYAIASLLFEEFPTSQRKRYLLFSILIGITGAGAIGLIGTTSNDNKMALLILLSLYYLIKSLNPVSQSIPGIIIAGFAMGLAVGFKLVAACYGLGMLIAFLCVNRLEKRILFLYGLLVTSMLGGFLFSNGYWMVFLYQHFHNPFFPYYNNIFHSPFAVPATFSDYRYHPQHYFTLPFWLTIKNDVISDVPIREWRFAVIYLLVLFFLLAGCRNFIFYVTRRMASNGNELCHASMLLAGIQRLSWQKILDARSLPSDKTSKKASDITTLQDSWKFKKAYLFLFIFSLISYIIWFFEFTIYRYLLPLELLSGILIVYLTITLFQSEKFRQLILWACTLAVVITTFPYDFGRVTLAKDFFEVHVPTLPPQSTVILTSFPLAYTIPFFQKDVHFIGMPFFLRLGELTGDENFIMHKIPNQLQIQCMDPLIYSGKNLYSLSFKRDSKDFTRLPKFFWANYVLTRTNLVEPWTLYRLITKDQQPLLDKMGIDEIPGLRNIINRFPSDKLSTQFTEEDKASILKIMTHYQKNTPFNEYYNGPSRALYYQYGLLRDEASCISFETHMNETLELCKLKKVKE